MTEPYSAAIKQFPVESPPKKVVVNLKDLTNQELVDHLKEVVWKGGWDTTIKEIERRFAKLTKLENPDK